MGAIGAVIIGAGGHGREVLQWLRDSAEAMDVAFLGFLDDGAVDQERLDRIAARCLGGSDQLSAMPDTVYYIGIGNPAVRRKVSESAALVGHRAGAALAHPRALVGRDVILGDGSILGPGCVVTTNVRVGAHVYLGSNVVVGHDTAIDDFVSIYPGATISGDVVLDAGVTVGTNAAVKQGIRIGEGATIGAGAVVVRDIPSGAVAMGVPATPR